MVFRMITFRKRFFRSTGHTALETALITTVMVVIILCALLFFQGKLKKVFERIGDPFGANPTRGKDSCESSSLDTSSTQDENRCDNSSVSLLMITVLTSSLHVPPLMSKLGTSLLSVHYGSFAPGAPRSPLGTFRLLAKMML